MKAACILFFSLLNLVSFAQEKVTFYADDSLKVTADLYFTEQRNPFILLLHQAGSSRGEYKEIAPKLTNLGYNCLAVDLRSGNKSNYVTNETARRAKDLGKRTKYLNTLPDIHAAIKFIGKYNPQKIILFGSSYSASLSLVLANELDIVKAVIAYSPGEYFRPELDVKEKIKGLKKPIFVGTTDLEYRFAKELLAKVDSDTKTIFKPTEGRGYHGAKALWSDNKGSEECWFQLSYFFGLIK